MNEGPADKKRLRIDTSLYLSMRACDEGLAGECSPRLKKNAGRFHARLNSQGSVRHK
jgi:hypothetical protein